jgi:DNA-binding MltR family transcriptional regulator
MDQLFQQTHFIVTSGGVWTYEHEAEKEAFSDLEQAPDRAVAIVGGSIVDLRLEVALKQRLRPSKKALERAFSFDGALGTFSAKIDMAHLLGMVSHQAYRDLHLIREIRNSFAHDLQIDSFEDAVIASKLRTLSLVDSHIADHDGPKGGFTLQLDPTAAPPRLRLTDYPRRKAIARDRFVMTTSLITSTLGVKGITSGELI